MTEKGSDCSLAEGYFESALEKFSNLATTSGGVVSRRISLAGRTVRIQVSSGAMEQVIMPALSHLVDCGGGEPDLRVCAWDSESTGVAALRPGWSVADYRQEGYVVGFNDDRFHTAMQFDPVALRMMDKKRKIALYWTPAASKLPYLEIAAPLRPLLHEWLRSIGMITVHGGAVGLPDGGCFVVGSSGRGKSNLSLACLDSELFYAGDDSCFLSQSPHWAVHSLYCTGRIAAGDVSRHPHLRGAISNSDRLDTEKALFFLNERFGARLIRRMPLRAMVLPRVVGEGPTKIVPVSAAVAQRTVALSAIELSRWMSGRDTLLKVGRLLRDIPCYEVQLGASMAEVPVALARFLNGFR
jgi:hypothetical protein